MMAIRQNLAKGQGSSNQPEKMTNVIIPTQTVREDHIKMTLTGLPGHLNIVQMKWLQWYPLELPLKRTAADLAG